MEKQEKLFIEDPDLYEGIKPEVKVVTNNYISAGARIREQVIKKVWIIPTMAVAS